MACPVIAGTTAPRFANFLELSGGNPVHPERTRQIARDVTVFGAAAVPVDLLQQQDVGVEAAQLVEDGGVRRSPLDVPRDDLEVIFSVHIAG